VWVNKIVETRFSRRAGNDHERIYQNILNVFLDSKENLNKKLKKAAAQKNDSNNPKNCINKMLAQ
jgi:hypothetical protein